MLAIRMNIKADEITRKDSRISREMQSRNLTTACYRHLFCYVAHNPGKLTIVAIGLFINRDHSTVINSLKRFNNIIWSSERGMRLTQFEKECLKHLEDLKRYSKLIQHTPSESAVNTSV